MITINGKEYRNLVEQVQKNKEDIYNYHNLEQVLADWGIKVLGQLDEWVEPTGSFEFGDAYAVGTEPPYDYYIYTRRGENEGYWFNNGPISIVGPAGPAGESIVGPRGEPGSQIYFGSNFPTGDIKLNDVYINTSYDIFTYDGTEWIIKGNIKGTPGTNGISISSARIQDGKLMLGFTNGGIINVGQVVGADGQPGKDGSSLITDIIGTVESEEELATTFPVEEQKVNAGVLVKIAGYENEYNLYIIIDDVWTNTGRYGGGSSVYVNGEYEQIFNADSKVDKPTSSSDNDRLIGQTADGDAWYPIASATTMSQDVIPVRGINGHLLVPMGPTTGDDTTYQDNHAVSYGWTNSNFNKIKDDVYFWNNTTQSESVGLPLASTLSGWWTAATMFTFIVECTYLTGTAGVFYTVPALLQIAKSTKKWTLFDLTSSSMYVIASGTYTNATASAGTVILSNFVPSAAKQFAMIVRKPYGFVVR